MRLVIAAALGLLAATGHAAEPAKKPETGVERAKRELAEAAARQNAERMAKSEPRVGMSASEARNSRWGSPDSVNRTTTSAGVREQWVYRGYDKTRYLYVRNDVVESISE